MSLPATGGVGYRPRTQTDDLEDLIEDHLDDLLLVHDERFRSSYGPMHPRVRGLFEAYVRCGDPHCHEKTERIVPFSCKSRGLCPSCGQKRALLWAERMAEQVLPHVPYVQLVFTIPKMLRRYFLWHRDLYGDLCRAAYRATRTFFEAQFSSLEEAVRAMVVSPQSWGSLLDFHPYAHGLASLGVFTRDGVFHPAPEDLHFTPLEDLSQARPEGEDEFNQAKSEPRDGDGEL